MFPTQKHINIQKNSWKTLRRRLTAIQSLQGILYPTVNGQIVQTKNQQDYCGIKWTQLGPFDLIDPHRDLHPKEPKYTFFSKIHGSLSKIDHMIGHKTSLNRFKKIKITLSIFSDYNGLNQKPTPKKKTQKHSNTWRLNNVL